MQWRGASEPGEFPTIGYVMGAWVEAHCVIPDGPHRAEPYLLTDEMLRFLVWYYRVRGSAVVDDVHPGEAFWFERGGQLVRPQKWGKGPFSASIVCGEVEGPALFAGWAPKGAVWDCRDHGCGCGWVFEYDEGDPMGRAWDTPHVQVTAYSIDQTDNVWRALKPMIELGPLAYVIPDTGETRINLRGGGLVEPVTSSAQSRLGQRVTCVVQDETHSWTKDNGMRRTAYNQRRNLAGTGGRFLETTNAWDPIVESVAQETNESQLTGVYRDDVDPGPGSVRNKRERRRCMRRVYGDSWWVSLDRIDSEIEALLEGGEAAQAEQFFLNRKQPQEGAAFDVEQWKKRASDLVVPSGELVVAGVDGARFDDALGMVATGVDDGHQWPAGIWEVPDGAADDYEHPDDEVDAAMLGLFDEFDVWRVYVDPQRIEGLLDRWQGRWGATVVVPWYMHRMRPVAFAVRNFATAVGSGEMSHNGDSVLTRHIANARRSSVNVFDDEHKQMWVIKKDRPGSPRKIDGAAASVLSWEARGDCIAAGKPRSKRKSTAAFF